MRLAAVHGDADQAAKQLEAVSRAFFLEADRLLVDEISVPTRRSLRLGLARPGFQPSPVVVVAPGPTAYI
jgi:hypothetical protein